MFFLKHGVQLHTHTYMHA